MLLALNNWGDKLENGFTAIFGFIPELIAALLILIIGYIVAKVVGNLLSRLLQRAGLDRTLTSGQGGRYVSRLTRSPSGLLGRVAFWAIFLGAISLAVTALGINALTDFVAAIFAYLPNVIAALLIFLVAGALAAAVGALVARTMGDTPTGKIVGSIAPLLIMAIAAFMILDQLKIAEDIVRITYLALMGGLALALALAFGLGGRDVAARMLEGAYAKGQESREQVRRDLQQGRERAQEDLSRARDAAEERVQATGSRPGSRATR
jgi:small-conductance mechanosensitive channel